MNRESVIAFITGKGNKKSYVINQIIIISLLITLFSLAQFTFHGYSIFLYSMSHLGNSMYNPAGFFFFNWALIISGILTIPNIFFYYQFLPKTYPIIQSLAVATGVISTISMAFVGLLPHNEAVASLHDAHFIAAKLAFGFSFANIIITLLIGIRYNLEKRQTPKQINITFNFISIQFLIIILLTTILVNLHNNGFVYFILGVDVTNTCIWEWLTFSSLVVFQTGMIYISWNHTGVQYAGLKENEWFEGIFSRL